MTGGSLLGIPVLVTSAAIPAGSPTERFIALIDGDRIIVADDNDLVIDIASSASVEMSDTPSGGATQLVSLWQGNLRAVLAERWINWTSAASSAAVIVNVTY